MLLYNEYPKGSEWRRWDLHFHTPSSYDYKDKSLNAEDIIKSLVNAGISVVAITDHHHMDIPLIKKLQELGKSNQITVFPGIEFLSDARGKQPIHFIGIFSETCNLDYVWGQIKNKTSICKILGEEKKHNEVYCDLIETLTLINELGGISSIHAGEKSNSIENITHSLPHGDAQKTDIAQKINIYELGKEDDQIGYKTMVFPAIKKIIPMIICSDNHDAKEYLFKENCWIKADPTFEGLKQIIYEPEDRVRINKTLPEDKAGYQVIEKIEITNTDHYNTEILLNPNLNSIIGGRSTGKSILLGAIAKKLKTVRPIQYNDKQYNDFIETVSNTIKVIWKDKKEENNREIEYFQQGYMHEIARDETKFSKLIQDILNQKGKESILNAYNKSVLENSKNISIFINEFYQVNNDIVEKEQKCRDKGDKKGIEDEITKLLLELTNLNITELTVEDKENYDANKEIISIARELKQGEINDIEQLNALKLISVCKDNINYEITSLSKLKKSALNEVFESLKKEIKEKWEKEINTLIEISEKTLLEYDKDIDESINDKTYIQVLKAYNDNYQLTELEQKIKLQKNKLFEITTLLQEITSLKQQSEELKNSIKKGHHFFYETITNVISKLSDSQDDLHVKAKYTFKFQEYKEILYSSLNQQGITNQDLSNFKESTYEAFEQHLFFIFEKLIKNELILKGSFDSKALVTRLLTNNFYSLTYDIEYENDNFRKMSDGKKAFVVLKLLLDFSDKDCPILIDQPEDDLDNRAIYNDLVLYLRKKKKLRQIIVATHNPNIVVGADSELIICANQQGEKNANTAQKRFQYVSGSLEHTFEKIKNMKEVLEAQGIREHVCEILEGGDVAFKLREKKYSIKS